MTLEWSENKMVHVHLLTRWQPLLISSCSLKHWWGACRFLPSDAYELKFFMALFVFIQTSRKEIARDFYSFQLSQQHDFFPWGLTTVHWFFFISVRLFLTQKWNLRKQKKMILQSRHCISSLHVNSSNVCKLCEWKCDPRFFSEEIYPRNPHP